jgi:predicted nucleic acid-binding protein
MSAEIISTPTDDTGCEIKMAVRDVKDRPILCAAINARVDFILTGDKDFLESGIKNPRMITATEFLEL